MNPIISLKNKICESFTLSFEGSGRHHTNYAIAVIIGIFGFYIFNLWVHNNSGYENFLLRLLAAIFVFLLLIKDYWPAKLKPLLSWYWYFTLIYTLPFFFAFMLLHNASSNIWQINGLIGLVVLALFVDWIAYIILASIGIGAGLLAYYLTQDSNMGLIPTELKGVVLNYIAPIIYIMIFSTKRENIQQEKQTSLKMQAAAIAHEMRTPLGATSHMADRLKVHLPTLINTQRLTQEKDQDIPFIGKKTLQSLEDMPVRLEGVTRSTLMVIDMLLMNLRENLPETALKRDYISNFVKNSLHGYPLTKQEKQLIFVKIPEDFEIKASPDLVKHVFFNLLKNALHYLKAAGKGNITIWAEQGFTYNKLHFKDTGKGIPKNILPYIFDQFYSRTDHGTGIGLAFCKTVMQNLGGNITCESIEGEFTHFTLTFPVLKS